MRYPCGALQEKHTASGRGKVVLVKTQPEGQLAGAEIPVLEAVVPHQVHSEWALGDGGDRVIAFITGGSRQIRRCGKRNAYEVFANSAIASPFVQYKRAAFERPGEVPTAFSLDLVAKDYELILGLAERFGAVMNQARTGRMTVELALLARLGGKT